MAAAAGTVADMDLQSALSEHFGFGAFRPGQLEACRAALADRDVMVVMPTGSGKSLCYQLPALLRDDLSVVVSPLVALMQDQVEALEARGLGGRVALINAQRDAATNAESLARATAGELRLLYVAPERFSVPGFADRLRQIDIGLFVVDEAHCVSQWGHDFRPDYFRLGDAARYVGASAVVASTATATPRVARDVEKRLRLSEPMRVATGFDRPNLSFVVARPARPARALLVAENRDKALHVHFIKQDEVEDGLPGWLADRLAACADGDGRYSMEAPVLARELGGGGDRLRSLVGHLARAGVLEPSPAPLDRVSGRFISRFDGPAAARCRASIEEAARVRWRQYRDIWAYVEGDSCRRRAILVHFGDRADPAPAGPCCDVCEPSLRTEAPPPSPEVIAGLDDAIISVARAAQPSVGRTLCAEIVHGGRSQKIKRNSYDGLPAYAASSNMRRADILGRVDELISEGRLETTGGAYPVLRVAAAAAAA